MNKCNFNCNQGRSCKTPQACWLPEIEPHEEPGALDTFVIALWIAVAIVSLLCAVLPALVSVL